MRDWVVKAKRRFGGRLLQVASGLLRTSYEVEWTPTPAFLESYGRYEHYRDEIDAEINALSVQTEAGDDEITESEEMQERFRILWVSLGEVLVSDQLLSEVAANLCSEAIQLYGRLEGAEIDKFSWEQRNDLQDALLRRMSSFTRPDGTLH